MTYGWAILVVIVAIAALAYFGVLSPDVFLPATCDLPPGLSCLDHRINYHNPGFGFQNDLTIYVKNNMGTEINPDRLVISGFLYDQPVVSSNLKNGDSATMTSSDITGAVTTIQAGERYSFEFTFTYINTQTNLPHQAKGYVRGKVN